MKVYLDTSALLRLVLREPGALESLRQAERLVSSELIAVEAHRTLDRLRLQGALTTEEAASRSMVVSDWLEAVDLVLVRAPVLSLAGEPLPVPLGTLDAIHLATVRAWRDRFGETLSVATHDTALGLAARAYGFEVEGA